MEWYEAHKSDIGDNIHKAASLKTAIEKLFDRLAARACQRLER